MSIQFSYVSESGWEKFDGSVEDLVNKCGLLSEVSDRVAEDVLRSLPYSALRVVQEKYIRMTDKPQASDILDIIDKIQRESR